MTTKITLIYNNPTDPGRFEADFAPQVALARVLPGLTRLESAKVWPKEDGSVTPAYRLLDLYFADYETASAAVTTPEAGALFANVQAVATSGVTITFSDVEHG